METKIVEVELFHQLEASSDMDVALPQTPSYYSERIPFYEVALNESRHEPISVGEIVFIGLGHFGKSLKSTINKSLDFSRWSQKKKKTAIKAKSNSLSKLIWLNYGR